MILTLILVYDWRSRQLDFILAYPQADMEGTIYMKLLRVSSSVMIEMDKHM